LSRARATTSSTPKISQGAGAYPLSETETRSVVLFLLQHPNVSIVQTMDTAVPMHLRPPSTSRSEESMFEEDLKLYRYFDEQGKKLTGFKYTGDVYWDYANIERDHYRETEEEKGMKGFPLFGHSPDFGYFSYGAIWYGDELWCGGRVVDYDRDGKISELERLRWNDEALAGKGFKNWEKFSHPQLGEVEIGGFNPKFFSQNPPPEFLEEWAKKEALFNLLLAKSLPQVKIVSVEARPLRKEPGIFEVRAVFANEGFLPTALAMAEGKKKVEIGRIKSGERKDARWKVKIPGKGEVELEVSISSTRGGVEKKKIQRKG
jgi:hypothetical protein